LSFIFGIRFFTDIQLVGAVILVLAIFSLSTPRIIQTIKEQLITEQRTYLFVCPGNTGRSPMAQAICMNKMMAFYENNKKRFKKLNINILSAAISGSEGRPMSTDALYALETLQFKPIDHSSNSLSNIRMDAVDKIWCMSTEHKEEILQRFPEAKDKVFALDGEGAIPNPHGQGKNAYVECARQLEGVIDRLIHKSEIAFA
jgi:protein-tyrosine phosphatase